VCRYVRAGALLSIAFVHNIIRRHPACMVMLHKPTAAGGSNGAAAAGSNGSSAAATAGSNGSSAAATAGSNGSSAAATAGSNAAGVDVYDPSEPDPAKSRAVESSLWELEALRNHYSPQVSCTSARALATAAHAM
jgi:U3 small nucleolar RNA-associated protein 19